MAEMAGSWLGELVWDHICATLVFAVSWVLSSLSRGLHMSPSPHGLSWVSPWTLSWLCKKSGYSASKSIKVETSRFLRHKVTRLMRHPVGFSASALLTFGAG